MPDWQTVQWLINIGAAFGLPTLGWFARTLYDRVSMVETDLARHKVEVAKEYVSYIRFSETMSQVHGTLGRIEGKLDSKADK
jgi:predicted O-methyltransferase YrrM